MKCPDCGKYADVLETRDKGDYVRRRYRCFNDHRFSTMEQVHAYRRSSLIQTPAELDRTLVLKLKELLK